MERLQATQEDSPCVLHKTHTPVTVVNELHHPFPQEWQKELWGEVRDNRRVSLCATGHNNVHAAIENYKKTNKFPDWCVGATRDLAELAFSRYEEAKKENNNG
jgi:hypothetical protein